MPQPLLGYGLSRTAVLAHHLQHNHFPPVDERWIPIAEEAIEAVIGHATLLDDGTVELDDFDFLSETVGQGKTVNEVMEGLHLWDFVTYALSLYDSDEGDEPKRGE
jgi:hypothetical protein